LALRACILLAEPKATEFLAYNVPVYALVEGEQKRDQRVVVAGTSKYVVLSVTSKTVEQFRLELDKYKMGRGAVFFPIGVPLPIRLIVRILKFRVDLLKAEKAL